MRAKIKVFMISCLSFLLIGCANSMYFYETEKISLSVEARPDSSQPVQGNLGIKQRVALVVPKKCNDTGDSMICNDGLKNKNSREALSAISSFSFNIIPKSWTPFNAVLIQTAFITGEAASQFDSDSKKAAAVSEAITIEGAEIPSIDTYARCIFDSVKFDENKRRKLRQIVEKNNFTELSKSEWEEQKPDLANCGIHTRLHFTDTLRKELQKEMNKS